MRDHVARPVERAVDFTRRIADRPAHLPCQLERQRIAMRFELIAKARADRGSLGDGRVAPRTLCMRRTPEHGVYLVGTGQGSFAIHRAIYRAGGFLCSGHVFQRSDESDDLEITRQFPVGYMPPELALFPLAAGREMLDKLVTETGARRRAMPSDRCAASQSVPRQRELGRSLRS